MKELWARHHRLRLRRPSESDAGCRLYAVQFRSVAIDLQWHGDALYVQ